MKGYGLRIKGAEKGKDSIQNGIQWIQDLEIIIHPRCVNFLTEISNYTWDKDKFDNKMNKPIDEFNHLMDAMGVDENGGVDFKTVDIPYEARKVKLELDEKNIYRFGMGLNTSGLKDTAATTNIAIKAAYSLLDLKCSKIIIRLKQFLRKLIKVVLDEINAVNGTDYQQKDVYFDFKHEIMSNEQENAQIKQMEAQTRQAEVETLLNVATHLDNETFMQLICEQLDIDYEEIKGKLPDPEEAENAVKDAQGVLDSVVVEDEQTAEGNTAGIS